MTPGTPRLNIQRPINDIKVLNSGLQRNYCSGVGMMLYLTKYSCLDISNIVRDLSKCMDLASWGLYQELLCVITAPNHLD
jgi:hypothetical protein